MVRSVGKQQIRLDNMREHPTENEVTKEWLDGDNLFYRKTDKPHYLKAISALENEDKKV